MYLFLPKDPCDVGTPVAPEEKNIVDMPAMDFCFFFVFFSSVKPFHGWSCVLSNFVKAALERNANSNHQVCNNFNKRGE